MAACRKVNRVHFSAVNFSLLRHIILDNCSDEWKFALSAKSYIYILVTNNINDVPSHFMVVKALVHNNLSDKLL